MYMRKRISSGNFGKRWNSLGIVGTAVSGGDGNDEEEKEDDKMSFRMGVGVDRVNGTTTF